MLISEKTGDLSLDQYLAKTTSEDNASFVEILKEGEKRHRDKHAWLYDKEEEQSKVILTHVLILKKYIFTSPFYFALTIIISRSSQCSTTGVTKAVVCVILSVGWCI